MKTLKYILLPVLFLMTSCYIYKPYVEKENEVTEKNAQESKVLAVSQRVEKPKEDSSKIDGMSEEEKQKAKQEEIRKEKERLEAEAGIEKTGNEKLNPKNSPGTPGKNTMKGGIHSEDKPPLVVIEEGIKGKLQPNLYYKIEARGEQHKIQVDQWEGDSLVSHIIRRPEKTLKFHKDEINEETILERRFSRPFSDLLTVGAYAAVGAAVLLIVL